MTYYGIDYTYDIYHHGIKGQKWGVRRFQNPDGSLTPAGRERYGYGTKIKKTVSKNSKSIARKIVSKYYDKRVTSSDRFAKIGKKHVDTFLESNTGLYRIQSSDNFENFAFYATYEQHDINQYAGLFGKNLISRANAEAKAAEREAKKTGDYEEANRLRERADSMNVYQLEIKNKDRLKIPSDDNASRIIGDLLKDKDFHNNLRGSLEDSKSKMKRPSQQALFKEALKLMNKDPSSLSKADKSILYKASNLSLTNHNEQEQAMQAKFYGAMKKEGYSALLDLNDRSYSSYHAKSPVIVFDLDKVALQSVTKMDNDKIDKLYSKYNTERIIKDIPEQLVGNIAKYSNMKYEQALLYNSDQYDNYLGR